MARDKPAKPSNDGIWTSIKENWSNEYCSEHNGTVADFEKLDAKLNCLSEYKVLTTPKCWNLSKGSTVLGFAIGGGLIMIPATWFAAPAIASTLGACGVLGTASTGTAISTLSGAALTSASLAAIGPGGVAGGMALLTVCGAGFGSVQGAVLCQSYIGEIQDFGIFKKRIGQGPSLIFINGFLSQDLVDPSEWLNGTNAHYHNNESYLVTWESKVNRKLGELATTSTGLAYIAGLIAKLSGKAAKSNWKKIGPLGAISTIAGLARNPWHIAVNKASMTGVALADIISRTHRDDGYTIMAHSLGTRVAFYLLNSLAANNKLNVKDVILLGGAVGRNDAEGWRNAAKAISGKIYNCYTTNDRILKYLYGSANAFMSSPIGLGEIGYKSDKIVNLDVSSIVNGHMNYKENLSKILTYFDIEKQGIKTDGHIPQPTTSDSLNTTYRPNNEKITSHQKPTKNSRVVVDGNWYATIIEIAHGQSLVSYDDNTFPDEWVKTSRLIHLG